MKEITSKDIKNFILDPTNDLDDLFDYIISDYKPTIEGIFSALYKLLIRNYEQNKSRSDYLIRILDSITEDGTEEELKFLNSNIQNLNNNIHKNIKKKEIIKIHESLNKLGNIYTKASNKLITSEKNNKLKYLEYFIFSDKNLHMIETTINSNSKILNYRNKDGDNIFAIILKRYLYLNENDQEEINYLYNVILLFIESKLGHRILSEKNRYQRIIKQSKQEYKEHIIKVIEIFDPNFKISLNEIEERYNINFDFPQVVYHELNTFIMDNDGRVNFTHQDCITIDGENSSCLDDALYIEKNGDGTHSLYIHIADIPCYIPYHSSVNDEARKRIETLYLRDKHISLYPDIISDRYCSLLLNNNRNVITFIYKLDPNYRLIDEYPNIVKGKIMVKHKLSYDEADKRIRNLTDCDLDILLGRLYLFSLNQKKSNPDKDAYRILENYLEFKPHHESLKTNYSPSANIVHETMVLNNYGVSKVFKELDLPYMYRKLYIPTDDFIDKQISKIKSLDEKLGNNESFRNNLKSCYSKAIYTDKPVYHKGQNLSSYSHSSAPLRRYPDSYGQYLIYDFLFNQKYDTLNIQKWEHKTIELVKYVNKQNELNDNFSKHYNYLSYKKLIKEKKK